MNLFKRFIIKILSFLNYLVPKNPKVVVFKSFPDFSDNSFALFLHLTKANCNKKIVWFVKEKNSSNFLATLHLYKIPPKKVTFIKTYSVLGVYYFLRAKYIFYTHGLYIGVSIPKSQIIVNLWHGMPLKNIGILDGKKGILSSFSIATSEFYQKVMSDSLGLAINQILVCGLPRNDLLKQNINCLEKFDINKSKFKKIILWAPTYRKSNVGDIRTDGSHTHFLPLLSLDDITTLNQYLCQLNSHLIIKLHPMDVLNLNGFKSYSNITFMTNHKLFIKGVQFYSILAEIDILITDYSSVYLDFLLLNKPIAFIIQDISQYQNSRGFIFENYLSFMPGKLIYNKEELFDFIDDIVVNEKDYFIKERQNLNLLVNKNFECFSNELLKQLRFN